jgi:hypothetical protein
MREAATVVTVLSSALLLAGCGGSDGGGGGGAAAKGTLSISNQIAGKSIGAVYLSPASEVLLGARGDNILSAFIAAGASADVVGVAGGGYNAIAIFDDGSFAYFEAFEVANGEITTWTVTEVGVPTCGLLEVSNSDPELAMTGFYAKLPAATDNGPNMLGVNMAPGKTFRLLATAGVNDVKVIHSDGSETTSAASVTEGAITSF